ncbi:unnamed protein product [Pseudo-nitzschia multistriata]|uniref:Uncharacterized protein n=1 Tax=Pseudo-nitzschia multistriata TaxID=183589 RepID=A0A448ZKZ9_9STRA|nr:unnamed protein product [Pseudo-nitzschia multistriata]
MEDCSNDQPHSPDRTPQEWQEVPVSAAAAAEATAARTTNRLPTNDDDDDDDDDEAWITDVDDGARNGEPAPPRRASPGADERTEISRTSPGKDDRFVDVVATHTETAEGYGWEGILDLRERLRNQEDHIPPGGGVVSSVLEYALYLTGDDAATRGLEEPRACAAEALERSVGGWRKGSFGEPEPSGRDPKHEDENENEHENDRSPVEDPSAEPATFQRETKGEDEPEARSFHDESSSSSNDSSNDGSKDGIDDNDSSNDDEGYASPAVSPLDVLASTLSSLGRWDSLLPGNKASFAGLTELVVAGPSLELSERGIDRLAGALARGTSRPGLRRLVLHAPVLDKGAAEALGAFFRSPCGGCLEDLSFSARGATEAWPGDPSRSLRVPVRAVLGPALSEWVDAWTRGGSEEQDHDDHDDDHHRGPGVPLRSLNLSRTDLGNEGAFALSRLLLAGSPGLRVLQLARNPDRPSCSGGSGLPGRRWRALEREHPALSFAGTKRLLESLILLEDLETKNDRPNGPHRRRCPSLEELDLSGWVLEDDRHSGASNDPTVLGAGDCGDGDDDDDDNTVDNYYDDYDYIDGYGTALGGDAGDGGGDGYDDDGYDECGFEGPEGPREAGRSGNRRETHHPGGKRACSVVASMVRVNTSLRRLVLASDGGQLPQGQETNQSGEGAFRRSPSVLSVKSTLAVARALRDHSSRGKNSCDVERGVPPHLRKRPPGSRLETLVLATDYFSDEQGRSPMGGACCSSWAVQERKRAVGRVFCEALTQNPIYRVRLQELSCTLGFKNLEPVGRRIGGGGSGNGGNPRDLREELESLLGANKAMNESLERIDSVWIPRASRLGAATGETTNNDKNDDDDDDRWCWLGSPDDPPEPGASEPPQRPSLTVLVLPELLARAGKEAAGPEAVFHSTRTLARETDLWEAARPCPAGHPGKHLGRRGGHG